MITSLKISNFQSHRDTALDFHPGVNVIVGASDSGKTSILRALRWLIWNRPNGEDFRSDWGGETIVDLEGDNFHIMRVKGKDNAYHICRSKSDYGIVKGEDWTELRAFGTKVPEQIQKALNIDDTNLQKQFDSPFLISSSPGEVAGYFNQVAHLERIDSSVSYVNGKILSLNSQHKADQVTLDDNREELKQYDYLSKFEIDLEELEHQQSEQTQRIASRRRLSEHLHLMATNDQMVKKQERILELEAPVDKLLLLHGERRDMREEMLTMKITLAAVLKKKKEEDALRRKAELLPAVEALLKLHKEREALWANQRSLRKALKEIRDTKQKQIAWETTLEDKENQFHEHMPDLCPLCGSKTT